MTLEVQLERKYIDEDPREIKARRERVIAILRKYRHYLLTPPPSPLTMEVPTMVEKGESHD